MDIKALATTATEVGIKIIIALVVMLIAFSIINKISHSLEKLLGKSGKLDKTITSALGYAARIALKVLVVLGLVSYLGINTAGIATIIASLGVGVGMAVNGAVANFGAKFGVPTPLNSKVTALIHDIEDGKLKPSFDNLKFF